MMKKIIVSLLLPLYLSADGIDMLYQPLFGKVVGLTKEDSLNVRISPDYSVKKVGTLPQNALVGIKRCESIERSRWCEVYQLAQNYYDESFYSGWVNAKYLEGIDRGYVIIDGVRNCDYALSCDKNMCKVVTDYEMDQSHTIVKLITHDYKRDQLEAQSRFGAASQEMDGYCTTGQYVEHFLKKSENIN